MPRSRIWGSGSLSDELRAKRVIDVLAICVWRLYQKASVVDCRDAITRQKTTLLACLWLGGRRGEEEQLSSILACWLRQTVGTEPSFRALDTSAYSHNKLPGTT